MKSVADEAGDGHLRIAADSVWFLLARISVPVSQLILATIIVSSGSIGAYGEFAALMPLALISASLVFGWLSQATLRFADCDITLFAATRRAFSMMAVTLLLSGLGAVVLAWPVGVSDLALVALVALSAPVAATRFVTLARLEAARRARERAVVELITLATLLSSAAGLAATHRISAVSLVGANLAALLVSTAFASGLLTSTSPAPTAEQRSRWFHYGWPLSLWLLGVAVYQFGDRWIILRVVGPDMAGAYSLLYDLSARGTTVLVFAIGLAYQPRIFDAYNSGDPNEAGRLIRESALIQLVIGAAVTLTILAAIRLTYRSAWLGIDLRTALIGAATLSSAGIAFTVGQTLQRPIQAANRTSQLLVALVASISLNIALNLATVRISPVLGPAGATLASAISYLVLVMLIRRRIQSHPEWVHRSGTNLADNGS